MTKEKSTIAIEVAYALPQEQTLLALNVAKGSTIKQAILQSGILEKYPDIDINSVKVGIFGKLKKMTDSVREMDRIEIYRPLIADPKEVRKKRAAAGKKMKKGAK
ncbi:MAG TPA: RnfH family protein [Thiothrix sp.]|nr:RnfH family protein [Thiothrix sp.]